MIFMRRGSISIFAALSLMLVSAVLLTLLEGARVQAEKRVLQANTDSALESVFAGYDVPMWENYHLLLRSAGATEKSVTMREFDEVFHTTTESALDPRGGLGTMNAGNFLRAELTNIKVKEYTLITDGKGVSYQNAVAAYMKHNLAREAAQKLRKAYDAQKEMGTVDEDQAVKDAQDGIASARNQDKKVQNRKVQNKKVQNKKVQNKNVQDEKDQKIEDDPLKAVIRLKMMGILTLVLPEDAKLSGQAITLKSTVSHRQLEKGNASVVKEGGWYEKILVQQYYTEVFSDYLSPNQDGALQYEREYLLGGWANDVSNLRSCVNKIIAVREAANLLFLANDPAKQAEALEIATMLAGASALPPVIETVKAGILAAWAYAESILDLRTLLQGEKIALIKTKNQWNTDIYHLSRCLSRDFRAEPCEGGMSYTDYVNVLLYTKGSAKMARRAMDLQELFLRRQEGYEDFRLDHMLVSASVEAEYQFSQNFLTLVSMKNWKKKKFSYQCESSYSYLKAGV